MSDKTEPGVTTISLSQKKDSGYSSFKLLQLSLSLHSSVLPPTLPLIHALTDKNPPELAASLSAASLDLLALFSFSSWAIK